MNEDFYPYIFTEDLYVLSPQKKGGKNIASPSEHAEVKTAQIKDQSMLKTIHQGNSSALCVVFWVAQMNLSSEEHELLNKIISACKLSPSDIGLFHSDLPNGLLFTDELPASKALIFCSSETMLSAQKAKINLYTPQALSGKQILLSDPLSVLAQNNALKANLWKSLQVLLNIK